MSQKDLAVESGVSVTTIKDFEQGKRGPKPVMLTALLNALKTRQICLVDDDHQTGVALLKTTQGK